MTLTATHTETFLDTLRAHGEIAEEDKVRKFRALVRRAIDLRDSGVEPSPDFFTELDATGRTVDDLKRAIKTHDELRALAELHARHVTVDKPRLRAAVENLAPAFAEAKALRERADQIETTARRERDEAISQNTESGTALQRMRGVLLDAPGGAELVQQYTDAVVHHRAIEKRVADAREVRETWDIPALTRHYRDMLARPVDPDRHVYLVREADEVTRRCGDAEPAAFEALEAELAQAAGDLKAATDWILVQR